MKIYNVGRDELWSHDINQLDNDKYEYLIYKYEDLSCGSCCCGEGGAGIAVLKDKNGQFALVGLDHCSCCDALKERNPECIYSLYGILKLIDERRKEGYPAKYIKKVTEKLKELEGVE